MQDGDNDNEDDEYEKIPSSCVGCRRIFRSIGQVLSLLDHLMGIL